MKRYAFIYLSSLEQMVRVMKNNGVVIVVPSVQCKFLVCCYKNIAYPIKRIHIAAQWSLKDIFRGVCGSMANIASGERD